MGLFRPYQSNDATDQPAEGAATETTPTQPSSGKSAPTLGRREAEQQRRERLRPTLTKQEQKARNREVRRAREQKAYQSAESQPERVLLRNFVDSRWTFSEFSWPLLLLSMSIFLVGSWLPRAAIFASYALWAIMAAIVIEISLLWFKFKQLLVERVPNANRRGLLMYMASRMVAMRRFRRPPTAIDRGAQF